ncbi:hypothetical protein QCE47_27925 [Caballeronia sp. LZ025]|uniref:hypothetical protein n=1 Tax=Caballeronia TaxID=1827195 RepID=UPI001FD479F2|nr:MULTISPECIES: hypothetical protein [Caballeronia]MDR5736145.1 hypothetical protein [Caballeronia sp. LZ025]
MPQQPENQKRPGYFEALPDEPRQWLQAMLSDTLIAMLEGSLNMGLELLRHLAIVNGAGLAGVTALFGSLDTALRPAAISAAAWFMIGLTLALFTMLFAYISSTLAVGKMSRTIGFWVSNAQPFDKKQLGFAKWLAIPNWVTGAISIGCFVVGALRLASAVKFLL